MKYGPDIARMAALIGDPARANMLSALMDGGALTASELALEAGVTKQTASSHLAKLSEAHLIADERQGRHRYFRLADGEVARVIEALMQVAARDGPTRARPGPKEPQLRHARVCYDHLAGTLGVALYDGLLRKGWLTSEGETIAPTKRGTRALSELGVDVETLQEGKRALCRTCLDWSERRHHLAGALGAAILGRVYALKWAKRAKDSRIITFSPIGLSCFRQAYGLA